MESSSLHVQEDLQKITELGRNEFERGNTQLALDIFNRIDFAYVTPKLKMSLDRRATDFKYGLFTYSDSLMSVKDISSIFEAFSLKAKSLAKLGDLKEAAMECNSAVDIVLSALPNGFPRDFGSDSGLEEKITKTVELLPELWKLAGCFNETIMAYRKVLLYPWNLNIETTTKIQKKFAVFLLYSGGDYRIVDESLERHYKLDRGSFIPRNNIEEACLLLMLLLENFILKKSKLDWDPSIIDHLTYALSISGDLKYLAALVKRVLLPGLMERKEGHYTLELCYFGDGHDAIALDLLRNSSQSLKALLLASKICSENKTYAEEGVSLSRTALCNLQQYSRCDQMECVVNCLLGVSLSNNAKFSTANYSERSAKQDESLEVLEKAKKLMKNNDMNIVYNLSLGNAEYRNLDSALTYAKWLRRLEGESNLRSWILFIRILCAQKRLVDAHIVVNAALDQTEDFDQGDLLQIKAKIEISQGEVKNAVETYARILSILNLKSKIPQIGRKLSKEKNDDRNLEMETWNGLANIYSKMAMWNDAEICLSKWKAINSFSPSLWHAIGKLCKAKGLLKEAKQAYEIALDIDPNHVDSLLSTAVVLKQLGDQPLSFIKRFLTDALNIDRTNHEAWFHLGLLLKDEGGGQSLVEAIDSLHVAAVLHETSPIEPFKR